MENGIFSTRNVNLVKKQEGNKNPCAGSHSDTRILSNMIIKWVVFKYG